MNKLFIILMFILSATSYATPTSLIIDSPEDLIPTLQHNGFNSPKNIVIKESANPIPHAIEFLADIVRDEEVELNNLEFEQRVGTLILKFNCKIRMHDNEVKQISGCSARSNDHLSLGL